MSHRPAVVESRQQPVQNATLVALTQDKVQQRIAKMRAVQEGLTAAELASREKELLPQIAALEAKRELDQIWMHVRLTSSNVNLRSSCSFIQFNYM